MSYNDHKCSVHIQIGVCTRQTIGECREGETESERASEFEKTFILRNNMEKKVKRKKRISYNFCATAKRHNDANTSHTFTLNIEIGVRQ